VLGGLHVDFEGRRRPRVSRGTTSVANTTVEVAKKAAQAAGQFDYSVKSERTRGLAKVSGPAASRVDQDLAQILQ